jgi:hypothetical protein
MTDTTNIRLLKETVIRARVNVAKLGKKEKRRVTLQEYFDRIVD